LCDKKREEGSGALSMFTTISSIQSRIGSKDGHSMRFCFFRFCCFLVLFRFAVLTEHNHQTLSQTDDYGFMMDTHSLASVGAIIRFTVANLRVFFALAC